jgi:Di-haem cytochrome c peroxidase
MWRVAAAVTLVTVMAAAGANSAAADPLSTPPGMPPGTDFARDAQERPRQILRTEAEGGRQSYMVALGNTAFSSPLLFGGKARAAGLSCDTCHRQGDSNPRFYIPGLSARPGGLDPTTAFFNPAQDDGVANHVDIPSLRGVRLTAPYGRDGRIASLREFTRHVIVEEFAGDEPTPRILDALVAYMDQFEFLPNPKIDRLGALTPAAGAAAKRGQTLFAKPFAKMDGKSCASCHAPDALFTDGRRHDIGSGGVFDTPTLLNSRFTAPYFHDGRYATLGDVVAHFDRSFSLGLATHDKADLVAYLEAVGDGVDPVEPVTRQSEMSEVGAYVAVLDQAIDARDLPAIALVVDTVNFELDQIAKRFDNRNPKTGRLRRPDRPDVAAIAAKLIEDMTAVGTLAKAGQAAKAKEALDIYRDRARTLVSAYPGAKGKRIN